MLVLLEESLFLEILPDYYIIFQADFIIGILIITRN